MKINEELKEAVINVILNENRTINYEIHLFLLVSKLNRLKNFTLFHLTLRCNFFWVCCLYGCNRLRDGSQRAIAESIPPPSPAPPWPPFGNMLSVSPQALKRIFASSPTTTVL